MDAQRPAAGPGLARRPLRRLPGLAPRDVTLLEAFGLRSAGDLLARTPLELAEALGVPPPRPRGSGGPRATTSSARSRRR